MTAAPAPQILTLTGNLLAERTLDFETWAPGRTQRARAESFQVGGKGINVARMLRRLGARFPAPNFPHDRRHARRDRGARSRPARDDVSRA